MATGHKKLVFFIIDGCSEYYLDSVPDLHGLQSVIKNGVRTKYAKPIFPTVSLPNYYTMFTGLYAEEHGVFSNHMYDREHKEIFKVTMTENRDRWYEQFPEPLWVKAGRLGIRTCMYWPWFVNFGTQLSTGKYLHHGEDFKTFMKRYDEPETFQSWMDEKMSEVVDKLKDPCDQFIVIYWGTLDEISHKYGPKAKETMADLKLADECLVKLQDKLRKAGLLDNVDLLVVADHGQIEAPSEQHIHCDQHIGDLLMCGDIEAWCEGEAYLMIYPPIGKDQEVYEKIKKKEIPHVRVVRNEDVPERLRVKKAKRVPPIWIFADPGYSLIDGSDRGAKHSLGVHGYDNTCESMNGICIGRGPGFKRQPSIMKEEAIMTKDYYKIMCQLLGIKE